MKNFRSILAIIYFITPVMLYAQNPGKIEGQKINITFQNFNFTRSFFGADSLIDLKKGQLILTSKPKTDYFNEPDRSNKFANGQLLLKEVINSKPFTITARIQPEFKDTYDAGTLFIYSNNDMWQKFAFELDEHKNRRIVTVRTVGTSDDNNHEVIKQPFVYLKISSDGKQIGFYYSLDNKFWNLVRLYENTFSDSILIGIGSQSPIGNGIPVIFEKIEFYDKSISNFRLGL